MSDYHSYCLVVNGPNEFWECWDFKDKDIADKCYERFVEQKHVDGTPIDYMYLEEVFERDSRRVKEVFFNVT